MLLKTKILGWISIFYGVSFLGQLADWKLLFFTKGIPPTGWCCMNAYHGRMDRKNSWCFSTNWTIWTEVKWFNENGKKRLVKTIQWIVTNPTGIVWVVNFVGTPLMDGQSWNVTLWSPRCWKIWPIGSTYVLHHDFQDFHGTLCSPRSPLVHSDWSHRVCPRYKACLSLQLDTKQPETCIYIILWAHYFTTYMYIYIYIHVFIYIIVYDDTVIMYIYICNSHTVYIYTQ